MLKFITGNKGKVREISAVLRPVKFKAVNIDLEEIQGSDPYKIIKHKLGEAFKHHKSDFFIEDTSTYFKGLKNKLPGPFMKYFLNVLGPSGLHTLATRLGDIKAQMHTIIAYAKNKKKIHYFEGKINGKIVKPRKMGLYGFGIDQIFIPVGQHKTLSELKGPTGTKFSARNRAARKFKEFLYKNAKS